jgi:hypothetical protein
VRPLAVTLAGAHLLGTAFVAFLLFVLPLLPVENTPPEDQARAWPFALVGAALLALATGVGVARRRGWAFVPLALHLAVGLTFLRYALGESTHSDERLVLLALVVETPGVFAALLALE